MPKEQAQAVLYAVNGHKASFLSFLWHQPQNQRLSQTLLSVAAAVLRWSEWAFCGDLLECFRRANEKD